MNILERIDDTIADWEVEHSRPGPDAMRWSPDMPDDDNAHAWQVFAGRARTLDSHGRYWMADWVTETLGVELTRWQRAAFVFDTTPARPQTRFTADRPGWYQLTSSPTYMQGIRPHRPLSAADVELARHWADSPHQTLWLGSQPAFTVIDEIHG